ncbi:MAG: diguanylate cyclase [Polyangiaceae bacterium]|nr:diguanylate cyclase [Polyangiaceae bacterium]
MSSDAILDLLPDAILVVDRDGNIELASRACAVVFGYAPEELVGRPVSLLVPARVRETHARHQASYQANAVARPMRAGQPLMGLHRDGHEIELVVALAPLEAAGGAGRCVAVARLLPPELAQDLHARLTAAAVAAAANGIVIVDAEGVIVHVNEAFCRLSGYDAEEVLGRNTRLFKSGAHDAAFYAKLWQTVLGGEVWTGELVNRRKDGSTYVEEQTITPVRDADGAITHFIAIKQDVTQRRADQAALVRRVDELTLLHELALLSASSVRPAELARSASAVVADRLGLVAFEVVPCQPTAVPEPATPSEAPAPGRPVVRPLRVGGECFGTLSALFRSGVCPSRDDLWLLDTIASQLGLALKNAYLVEQLDRLAHTDALTALHNRRHFLAQARVEVERTLRHARPLSLAMLDVDHFKAVNDTRGHAYGDDVLRRFGEALRTCSRVGDIVARFGGEEFVMLLPDTPIDGAIQLLERVRQELGRGRQLGQPWCAFSAGVADHGDGHEDLETMLRVADDALYTAKATGRERTVVRRAGAGVRKDFASLRRSSRPPSSPR